MKRKLQLLLGLAGGFAVAPVEVVSAQDFPSLIQDVSSISFSMSCWNTRAALNEKDCWGKTVDYGIEVSYNVTKIAFPGSKVTPIEGLWKPVRKEVVNRNGRPDSTLVYEPIEDSSSMSSFLQIELAVGYSQFQGFTAADPSFDLRGSVREIPSVSIYGTVSSDDVTSILRRVRLRMGIRSGLIQLNDAQILDPIGEDLVNTYTGTAQTFQLGGLVGVALALKHEIMPYVDYGWEYRKFASVNWAAAETPEAPERIPRVLDFTGPFLTVGVRIQLK